jgi:peptidoglycan hydrolase-like protein with peptidoglycan-binding domain
MRLSTLLLSATTALTTTQVLAADCNRADYFKPGAYNLYMPFRGNSIACQLAEGNNSDAVKALQTQLNLCNGASLDVDGDFGGKTKAALKKAQKANGADDDGVYGPETRSLIKFGLYFNGNPADKVCKRLSAW